MPSLLTLVQSDKQRWLKVPRFAIISWPLILVGVSATLGYHTLALALIAIFMLGCARLLWFKLLPHECSRLGAAKLALNKKKPQQAMNILQKNLWLAGTHYLVIRAQLMAECYIRQSDFINAHEVLFAIKREKLLSDEQHILSQKWALLYLAADNPAEALRKLSEIPDRIYQENLDCLLTKAELELLHEHNEQARILLEAGLAQYRKPEERVLLHNNMARLEGMVGRSDAQLRHLQAARVEFNKSPRADLTDIVHHNLAIAFVKEGEHEQACQVLNEAFLAGDIDDLQHVLEVLNNHLYAAREAADAAWKNEVYAQFDQQLKRLQTKTQSEQLALDVSRLRMMRNDLGKSPEENYPLLINRLLDVLDQPIVAIPASDCISALVEIRHDLRREIESIYFATEKVSLVLVNQFKRSAKMLLAYSQTIDAHITRMPPQLIGPLLLWHSYRTDVDKAKIELAQDTELQSTLNRLFRNLQERAEWLSEQGTRYQATEAWLIICDELVAYHDQSPTHEGIAWENQFNHLAQHALEHAIAHMNHIQQRLQLIDQLIGLAYFTLRLRNNKSAAAYWINRVKALQPALEQYASWVREHYEFVCIELAKDN